MKSEKNLSRKLSSVPDLIYTDALPGRAIFSKNEASAYLKSFDTASQCLATQKNRNFNMATVSSWPAALPASPKRTP